MLKGPRIYLRTIEPNDAAVILQWENDAENWRASNTVVPFSMALIEQYVQSAQDIFNVRQIRFMICENGSNQPVGAIDLFEYEPLHQRAGVGILIQRNYRKKGFAAEALQLINHYCKNVLGLKQIHAGILTDNNESIQLFEKAGFERMGLRKEWYFVEGEWLDEVLYQKKLV